MKNILIVTCIALVLLLTGIHVASAAAVPDVTELVFSAVQNTTSPPQSVIITNTGGAPIQITNASIIGGSFNVTPNVFPIVIGPGATTALNVTFSPAAGPTGILNAILRIVNTAGADVDIPLFGIRIQQTFTAEPDLQTIFNAVGFSVDAGGTGLLPTTPALIGDEVDVELFEKAGPGNVTVEWVANFGFGDHTQYGFYLPGPPVNQTELGIVLGFTGQGAQMLYPDPVQQVALPRGVGLETFDPGAAAFGIYTHNEGFVHTDFTQDALNTGPISHAVRVYPHFDRAGAPVANSFILAFEDASNGDYNDFVLLLGNVRPVGLNSPPVANDDTATTPGGQAVVVPVLNNDTDPDGDPLTVISVTQGANGTVTHNGATVTYTPAPGFVGVDSFTYTINDLSDGNGAADTATVTITVQNNVPIARSDTGSTTENTPITVDVLANDSDDDGHVLTIVAFTQGGSGTVGLAGTQLVYTPAPGFSGTDSFTYTIDDGNGGISTAIVTVQVVSPVPPTATPITADASTGTIAPAAPIIIFDPAITKLGFLLPGQVGQPGERIQWFVTVRNNGNATATNVVVQDTLRPELQIERVDVPGGTYTVNGQTLTVTFASLAPGESALFTLTTVVIGTPVTPIDNTACVMLTTGQVCSTGTVIQALPRTGETPIWRMPLLFALLMVVLGGGMRRIRTHP